MAYRYTAILVIGNLQVPYLLNAMKGTDFESPEQTAKGDFTLLEWKDLRGWPCYDDPRAEEAFNDLFNTGDDIDFAMFGDEPEDCRHFASGIFVTHPALVISEEDGWPAYRITI